MDDFFNNNNIETLKFHIENKTGIVLNKEKILSSKNKIIELAKEINKETFQGFLGNIYFSEEHFQKLIDIFTINETKFFRNESHFKILKKLVNTLSEWKTEKNVKINIWSAGCSTGEEPYSIAIILKELGMSDESVNIIATDISESILEKARRGIYRLKSSAKRIDKYYIDRYFQRLSDGDYAVNKEIKNLVEFKRHNLIDFNGLFSIYERPKILFDVIFCKNVLIYFSKETVGKLIHNFYDALHETGYLFLGYSESISTLLDKKFEPIFIEDSYVYKKSSEAVVRAKMSYPSDENIDDEFDFNIDIADKQLSKLEKFTSEYYDKELYIIKKFYSSNKLTEAIEHSEELLKIFPLDIELHFLLGILYKKSLLYKKALGQFDIVLSMNKYDIGSYLNISEIYIKLKQYDKAIKYYKKIESIIDTETDEDKLNTHLQDFNKNAILSLCDKRITKCINFMNIN